MANNDDNYRNGFTAEECQKDRKDRDTSKEPKDSLWNKEHGERIAAREAANTPWSAVKAAREIAEKTLIIQQTLAEEMYKPKVENGLTIRPTKEEQQALDIRQSIALKQVYDILYRHIDNPFSDPAKCATFNESYEVLRRYYEEQYK